MTTEAPIIRLVGVTKSYDGGVRAVDNVSLSVQRGTLLALLGWSGCGKTTTLRLIAGLEKPEEGEIWLNGELVAGKNTWVDPEKRKIGMVFQDYALFPHMSVESNIAFAINHIPRRERRDRIAEMLTLVGLEAYGKRFPHQLSGGQQQRVALARALAPNPDVVLLDEPFSNLDAALRKTTRAEVRDILKRAEATTVFVTHDQEEALSISDQIAVIRSGRLLQVGTPREVYARPAQREVADFIGSASFLPGSASGNSVQTVLGELELASEIHGHVDVMVRPEQLNLHPDTTADYVVRHMEYLGYTQLVSISLPDGHLVQASIPVDSSVDVGMQVQVDVNSPVMAYHTAGNGTT